MRIPTGLEERYLRFLDGGGDLTEQLLSKLGEGDRLLDLSGAWAAAMLSRVYLLSGDLDRSLKYLQLSSRSFYSIPESDYPYGLWINRALIMKYRGRTEDAALLLRRVQRLCLRNDQVEPAARASSNLAVLLARGGRTEEAASHLGFSRQVYSFAGDRRRKRYMDLVSSVLSISRGEYRAAADASRRFLESGNDERTAYGSFVASLLLAEALLRSGRCDAAAGVLDSVESGSAVPERIPLQRIRYLLLLGAAAELRDGLAAGSEYRSEAMRIAEETGISPSVCPFSQVHPGSDKAGCPGERRSRYCQVKGRDGTAPGPGIITCSPVMNSFVSQVKRVSRSDFTVLLTGPTGTGKSLMAELIHSWSDRADNPFVAVNAATLMGDLFQSTLFGHVRGAFTGAVCARKGLVEAAAGGTLFLDEISELDSRGQAGLLKFLDSGTFRPVGGNRTGESSARIVTAANRDLGAMADSGEFRADLYHRLNVIRLEIPPLRARREDIIPLARYFLRGLSPNGDSPADLSEEACSALLRFRWPGNVRQLRNEIAAALFRSDGKVIKRSDLSTEIICSSPWKQEPSLPGKLARVESEEIMEALRRSGGNRAAAARLLGIKRTTLLYRIGKLGLD